MTTENFKMLQNIHGDLKGYGQAQERHRKGKGSGHSCMTDFKVLQRQGLRAMDILYTA